jgi:hypothetical protein
MQRGEGRLDGVGGGYVALICVDFIDIGAAAISGFE